MTMFELFTALSAIVRCAAAIHAYKKPVQRNARARQKIADRAAHARGFGAVAGGSMPELKKHKKKDKKSCLPPPPPPPRDCSGSGSGDGGGGRSW